MRRAVYWDKELAREDPAKKGVCSNFLCDSTPGTELPITGPTGKVMLMPEEKADTDYIMVATGTGIAPYRGFIRRLFTETTPAVGPALVALRELTAQATRAVRATALRDVSMMARAAREEVRRRGAALGGVEGV